MGITSTDGAKADYTAVSALCHDSADGSAALTITDGDGPFVIKWPDGQSTLQGTNLKGGDYTVSITDGHACTVVKQITVPAPQALTLAVRSSIPLPVTATAMDRSPCRPAAALAHINTVGMARRE